MANKYKDNLDDLREYLCHLDNDHRIATNKAANAKDLMDTKCLPDEEREHCAKMYDIFHGQLKSIEAELETLHATMEGLTKGSRY